jgi:hypothetical protein
MTYTLMAMVLQTVRLVTLSVASTERRDLPPCIIASHTSGLMLPPMAPVVPQHDAGVTVAETILGMLEKSRAEDSVRYAERDVRRLERENDLMRQQLTMQNVVNLIAHSYKSK